MNSTLKEVTDMTTHPFVKTLNARFGGVIREGKHDEDGQACALEARNAAMGLPWSDAAYGFPDIRQLNDSDYWLDDADRTAHLVPLVVALWDWADWTEERRQAWVAAVVLGTVREILPLALTRFPAHAAACRQAETLSDAYIARSVATSSDAAAHVAYASDAAAYAAVRASDAVRDADAVSAAYAVRDAADYTARAVAYAAYAARAVAFAVAYAASRAVAYADAASPATLAPARDVLLLACSLWTASAQPKNS